MIQRRDTESTSLSPCQMLSPLQVLAGYESHMRLEETLENPRTMDRNRLRTGQDFRLMMFVKRLKAGRMGSTGIIH